MFLLCIFFSANRTAKLVASQVGYIPLHTTFWAVVPSVPPMLGLELTILCRCVLLKKVSW